MVEKYKHNKNNILRYNLPNGFTYLQLGRDFINLLLLKYMPF